MWQSHAFAGALRLGASAPAELGTLCWAKPGVAAIASPPARNVRRLMRMRRLPLAVFGRRWADCTAKRALRMRARRAAALPALHGSRTVASGGIGGGRWGHVWR